MNPISLKIDPGQLTIVQVRANRIAYFKVFYQAGYGLPESERPNWVMVSNWSKEKIRLIRFPAPDHYVMVVWAVQNPDNVPLIMPIIGGTVNIRGLDLVSQEHDEDQTSWQPANCDYWKFAGQCQSILVGHRRALQALLKEMYCKPGRSRQMCIVDLNRAGGCPGHPAGHASGFDVDFCYYTHGPDNETQCSWPNHFKIFTEVGGRDIFDPGKFDIKRNWKFWKLLKMIFPKCIIRVDERIKKGVQGAIAEQSFLHSFITGDPPGVYKHDTHAHVSLGEKINWEYFKNG